MRITIIKSQKAEQTNIIIENLKKKIMQKRHVNRRCYFEEQALTSKKYYIPIIKSLMGYLPDKVLEVGCGEGGNLLPFAELGCEVVGVDIANSRIQQARSFFADKNQKAVFIATDIFKLRDFKRTFSLILIHDVIEHIDHKDQFLYDLRNYLTSDGIIFIAFPAWLMPFGGHQQIAKGKIISRLPFVHLLPYFLYKLALKVGCENEDTIEELLSIRQTRCSVELFRKIARQVGYEIISEQLYLINPHYEVKFGLSPRRLSKFISSIPYLRNFFSTSCFYILKRGG